MVVPMSTAPSTTTPTFEHDLDGCTASAHASTALRRPEELGEQVWRRDHAGGGTVFERFPVRLRAAVV
jgi:hypothetical protein